MEVITPTYLREDYEGSTEEERRALIRSLVKMAGQGASSDEACATVADAGWRPEFVRWAYIRARSDGEFTLVAPLDERVRQQVQTPSVFEQNPGGVLAGLVGGIVVFCLVGSALGPGVGMIGGVAFWRSAYVLYKQYFTRTDSSEGRWIDPD